MVDHTVEMVDVGGHKAQIARGGAGAPLVYLHSAMGETSIMGTPWLPFIDRLAASFDVVSTVYPGFGESEAVDDIDEILDLAFWCAGLFDALGFERAHVVGHSLGGWLAAELATFFPDRVDRLVLSDAVGIWLDEKPIAEMFGVMPSETARLLFAQPENHPLGQMLLGAQGQQETGLPREIDPEALIPVIRAMSATARVGWNPYLHDPKLAKRIHRLQAPTLIVWGSEDALVDAAYADEWARLIPGAVVEKLDGVGHMPQLEAQEAWLAAVEGFLVGERE